jgi:hypothetical protein
VRTAVVTFTADASFTRALMVLALTVVAWEIEAES